MAKVYDVDPMLVREIFKEDLSMNETREVSVKINNDVEAVEIPALHQEKKAAAQTASEMLTAKKQKAVSKKPSIVKSISNMESTEKPGNDDTVISADSEFEGCVRSKGAVTIYGSLKGNVTAGTKVVVSGTLTGDIEAEEVLFNGSKVCGDVKCRGRIEMINGSVLVGNVTGCSSIRISGAVKGNVQAGGTVCLEKTAVIVGDITAEAIEVANGASISGRSEIKHEVDYSVFDFGGGTTESAEISEEETEESAEEVSA